VKPAQTPPSPPGLGGVFVWAESPAALRSEMSGNNEMVAKPTGLATPIAICYISTRQRMNGTAQAVR
jgi:hypothetical protein